MNAEELRQARDKAEEATRLKDDFLATVSHELRTPLNAILGWSRIALSTATLTPEKQIHAIDTIVRNATAQNQADRRFARRESHYLRSQLRLEVDVVDVDQIVSSAIEVVRPAAFAKNTTIDWKPSEAAGFIRGDAARLQQVLWNLLTNAVKFTPRGGRVTVEIQRDRSMLEIKISDTGPGIAREFLPHVFDRFTQEHGGKSRRTSGLGLGLAIVRHLVELHGGTTIAESEGAGKGSTFTVSLPLAPMEPERSSAAQTTTNAVTFPQELKGLKVLVLDDERDARELVQAVLHEGGARVTIASTVAEALEQIRIDKPHVIVSDIGMPEEDGYVFIRKLRELSREEGGRIPAIALTAYARADDRRRALLAGFQNHAAKPIEPQELVIVIANLTGR